MGIAMGSNFNGDWRHMENIIGFALSGCTTEDWSKVRFPKNVEVLWLDYTNFHGDLTYLKSCQELSLKGHSYVRWIGDDDIKFPLNLIELDLSNTDFRGDISHLYQLVKVKLCNDYETVYAKLPQHLEETSPGIFTK